LPTSKMPFGIHLDEVVLLKLKQIAKNETRSTSNLIEHLCKLCINEYETKHGEIKITYEQ